jgi:sulfate/thiosulfate transport system substrate-binding protein
MEYSMSIRFERMLPLAFLGIFAAASVFSGCNSKSPSGSDAANSEKTTSGQTAAEAVELVNVSYDPTREFYEEYKVAFANHWKKTTGQTVNVKTLHGGSGGQANKVIAGLDADVVTLALAYDIDIIAEKAKLLSEKWQARLPENSSPYTSTIVFLVKKGNPKNIKDWPDLIKDGVTVITPNPKTSGGARWNYLAAWGYVLKQELGDFAKLKDPASEQVVKAQQKAFDFVKELFAHVPKLDSGARGSTVTFTGGSYDVLLAWENEAHLIVAEKGVDQYEIVAPSISILAEPPVAVLDKIVEQHKTEKVALEYLQFLYSPTGQALAAKHHYRPRNKDGIAEDLLKKFPPIELFTVDDVFGGWKKAQADHFNTGGYYGKFFGSKE